MHILLLLAKAVEGRDPCGRGHAARVRAHADGIAVQLGWDEEQRRLLRLGAALHDVGKLAVPEAVLAKPGPLTPDEELAMRAHPRAGAAMVWRVPELRRAMPAVLFHHERWDGLGYPAGRAGERIPLEARILAVADCFDAMTTDRSYRAAVAPEDAVEELQRCAGSQFDPGVVAAFLESWAALPAEPLRVAS
jgi:HD-GYP domain-containing protein (c-di-GMP phosphodiesterase class II)